MSYITKFQAIHYYAVNEKNKVMKENRIDVKFSVERDFNGEWQLKKTTSKGNLPDKLNEHRKAKEAIETAIINKRLERAHWD